MKNNERILITGASGHLGRLTLEALIKAGQKNLVGTTRSPEKLNDLAAKGVEIKAADFKNLASLDEAFKGASKLLLISTTDVGARIDDHKRAIDAAKRAGVKHIVYTSFPNPEKSAAMVAPDHAATEQYIKQSGLKYTFLRNNLYAESLLYTLPNALQIGTIYGCAGTGKTAYVLREDCAQAAASALMHSDQFENQAIDITGPKAYSYAEIATIISENSSKKIVSKDLPPEEFKALSIKSGLPEGFAHFFASTDLSIKQGDLASVSNGVEKLTGRPAKDIVTFLKTLAQKS